MIEAVSPDPQLKVEVRDKYLNLVGEITDFDALELRLRLNDVSTWSITIPANDRMAPELISEGAGIVVRIDGQGSSLLSGYWTEVSLSQSGDDFKLNVSGEDDTGWLARRNAYPDPSDIVPPYTTQAQDTRTGVASTIMRDFVNNNMAGSAQAARKVYMLSSDPVSALGPSVTYSGAWQNMLTVCQEIAAASEARGTPFRFYIQQIGGALGFFIDPITDVSSTVRFSHDLGNLASFEYKKTAPKSNYAIVGGDGEGTARAYYEKPDSASIATWGRIEAELTDSRNSNDANEMSISADEYLKENAASYSLAIVPIDTPDQQYGIHYTLGSKVTVLFPGIGPDVKAVIGTGTAVVDSVALDKVTVSTAEAVAFDPGTKVQMKTADGDDFEFGVRVVTGQVVNGANMDIVISPPLNTLPDAGDYLEAFRVDPSMSKGIITDIVREVAISVDENGTKVAPAIGTAGVRLTTTRIYRLTRKLARRMVNLERKGQP